MSDREPKSRNGRLEGKRVLLTGAGSGMGRECANLFAAEGAALYLSDVVPDALEATKHDLDQEGRSVMGTSVVDVTVPHEVHSLVESAASALGGLDAAINWAGIADPPSPVHECPVELWERVMRVNLDGTFYFCRSVVPELVRRQGSLVVIASVAGLIAWPGHPAYCASKGAVLMLGRALAVEYAATGMRVNALCPGSIDTPMLDQIVRDEGTTREELLKWEPSGRHGLPEEVCRAALFLVSQEASFVNGAALVVDGGFTAT